MQIIYPTKDHCLEYIKISQNSVVKINLKKDRKRERKEERRKERKWAKDMKNEETFHFTKYDGKHTKRYSNLFAIRKI